MANSKNIAFELPSVPVSWNRRDVLLFANSIGCTADQLWYLYSHPKFAAFPTYPLMLTFKHVHADVISFREHFDKHINVLIPGAPRFDSARVVDGGRSLKVLKPLPVSSEEKTFGLRSGVVEVGDKGKAGTAVVLEHVVYEVLSLTSTGNGKETTYAIMRETAFYLGQGGWGGPRGSKPREYPAPADRKPDFVLKHKVPATAHLLYRLNGDYNPLHASPGAGKAAGFDGVIMHGLYTWNTVARQILSQVASSGPNALKEFIARFAKPVRPGDVLVTQALLLENQGDQREIRFQTRVEGAIVLNHGRAIIRAPIKKTANSTSGSKI